MSRISRDLLVLPVMAEQTTIHYSNQRWLSPVLLLWDFIMIGNIIWNAILIHYTWSDDVCGMFLWPCNMVVQTFTSTVDQSQHWVGHTWRLTKPFSLCFKGLEAFGLPNALLSKQRTIINFHISNVKCWNTLECLDQYACTAMRLWNSVDCEAL